MGILDDAIREHLELKRRHGADNQEVTRQEREILGGDGPGEATGAELAEAPAEAYYDGVPIEAELPVAEEPLAGSALAEVAPEPPALRELPGDIFPGTGELLAAASAPAPPVRAPEPPAAAPAPPLAAPAPSGADSETAARSGARRLSDEELAAWRRRLSERADRLAAQRPGMPAPDAAPAAAPAPRAPAAPGAEPPAYWSGNTTSADAGAPPPVPPAAPAPVPIEREVPQSGVPVDFFDAGDAASAFDPEPAPAPAADTDHDVLDETPDFLTETPEHDRMWFEQRPPRDFDFG